jgi:hypothetical protein
MFEKRYLRAVGELGKLIDVAEYLSSCASETLSAEI